MDNYLKNLLTYLTSISVITFAIGYLLKVFIENFFNKEIKRYETELNELTKREEIKFSRLHEDRALITKELYKRLYLLEKQLIPYMDIIRDDMAKFFKEEYHYEVVKSVYDFIEYANENIIYYEENIASLINEIGEIVKVLNLNAFVWQKVGLPLKETDFDEDWANNVYVIVTTKMPILKKELENAFRDVLGVKRITG